MATAPSAPQITPPYGFKEIVPLEKKHKVKLPQDRLVPATFRTLNAMPISFVEVSAVSRHYPIVFVSGDNKNFVMMAVFGLMSQQNLFVQEDGTWDPNTYLPAYVRRYPFCMLRFVANGKEARQERVTCVEKSVLDANGETLFNEQGQPLPVWENYQKLLFEYEKDLMQTEELCKLLAQHDLLEPFTMQAQPNGSAPLQLTGMYRVSFAKLRALDANILKDWLNRNILGSIYAHFFSLDTFPFLLNRHAQLTKTAVAEKKETSKKKKLN